MTTTLITGANKGLGHEAARRLIEAGHDVWIAGRNEDAGRQAADELGGRFVQLDVTDDEVGRRRRRTAARAPAASTCSLNNAGISGGYVEVPDTMPDHVRGVRYERLSARSV